MTSTEQPVKPVERAESVESVERILQGPDRRVTLPIPAERMPLWEAYKKCLSNFWVAEHFKFSADLNDWNNKLTDNERHTLSMILAFFAESDALVNANLLERFLGEVQWLEVRTFYMFQMAMESIHGETYALALQTYITNEPERIRLSNAASLIPCIAAKKAFADKYTNSNESFAMRLIAFAIFEGVFFSGAFCVIYWIKDRGLLKELCNSNEAISSDEGEHTKFACLLMTYIQHRPEQDVVASMFRDAVAIESTFITESIPCSMVGMNSTKMIQYIQYIADRLMKALGYQPIFNVEIPLEFRGFVQRIGAASIDNFFDKTNSKYSQANVSAVQSDPSKRYDDDDLL